jgi:hypothetical protein
MEFDAVVLDEPFHFAFLNATTVLVSGTQQEYILYKNGGWRCADEIPPSLMQAFSLVLDNRVHHTGV